MGVLIARDSPSRRHQHTLVFCEQLRRTYDIASIVPESDEAYYDCQPQAFISVSVRPYLCLHYDHRNTDVQ